MPEQKKAVSHIDALAERTRTLEAETQDRLDQLTALKSSLLDAAFFEVTVRTVENYLAQFDEELSRNGYEVHKPARPGLRARLVPGGQLPQAVYRRPA